VRGARARACAALALALLAGCPAPANRPALAPPVPLVVPGTRHDEPALAGVVHVVRRGETLWRIARTYGIEPADLMETNGISDPTAVSVGTELFVPGADLVLEVPEAGATPTATATSTSTATATAPPTTARPAPSGARLAWPLDGVLYGRYGVRGGQRHDGIDIAAPEGTPVAAAADGEVIFAGEQAAYGGVVILRHDGDLVTLYAHNARVLVKEGQRVRRGQAIATVGQTGKTTGPHLHFEVRAGTRPRNPLLYLP